MDQFVSILLTILFVSMVHQMMLHIRILIMFVTQSKNFFAMLIFNEKTSIIDVWIKVSLFTLFKDAVTTIIDEIELNLVGIKKVECVWNINGEVIMLVNDFDQSVNGGDEIQFLCVVIYINMQVIDASLLLLIIVLIEFGAFIPEFISFVFNPAGFSYNYKSIIVVDSKHTFDLIDCSMILLTKKQGPGHENQEQAFWTPERVKYVLGT